MSFAQTWVSYQNNTPFPVVTDDLPYLDFGIIEPNNYSAKTVVGIRFQGQAMQNIVVWLESYNADRYRDGVSTPDVQIDLSGLGYIIKATLMSPLTTYNAAPSTWSDIPTSQSSGLSLGNVELSQTYDAFTPTIGLALFVPTGEPDADIRNLRLMVQYDTLDE